MSSFRGTLEERAEQDLQGVTRLPVRPRRPVDLQQDPTTEVTLVRGDTIEPAPIDWLWEHWFACGKLHVLAGPPGSGKSTAAFSFAATVTRGGSWPDGSRAPQGNVLIWSGEDDPRDTIMPRLLAAGADPERVFIVTGTREDLGRRPFDPATDLEALQKAALNIGDIALLICDPIVSAVSGDSHKNTEVRRSLQPLVDFGAALKCAVLGITHFSKGSGGRDPTERVTGSIAFAALARVVLVAFKPDGHGPRVLARSKSNIGPDQGGFEYTITLTALPGFPDVLASQVVWGSAVSGSAKKLLGSMEEEQDDAEDDAATRRALEAEWMREILSVGQVPSVEMKKLCCANGIAWRTAHRIRKSIGGVCLRMGYGPGSQIFWSLQKHQDIVAIAPAVSEGGTYADPGKYDAGSSIAATDEHTCQPSGEAACGTNGAATAPIKALGARNHSDLLLAREQRGDDVVEHAKDLPREIRP